MTTLTLRTGLLLGLALVMALALGSEPALSQDDDLILSKPMMDEGMIPLSRVPNYRNRIWIWGLTAF